MDDARCGDCGFFAEEWTGQDLERTIGHVEALLAGWSDGAPPEVAPLVEQATASTRAQIDSVERDPVAMVHALWHGLVQTADVRRAEGDGAERATGTVSRINRSDGGVPKSAIERADVDHHGIVGDRQAARVHHGRPWQALCLWSAEVIDALAGEGHPIHPGAAGENVTISGIDWATMRAGVMIDIGTVRCQVSAPAEPCTKNSQWFRDGRIDRMDHDRHPGSSRWYATVVRPGAIATGDPVVVEPAR